MKNSVLKYFTLLQYRVQRTFIIHFAFFGFLSCFTTPAQAQDMIFRKGTIKCKILEARPGEYIYTYMDSNNMQVTASIARSLVDSVTYDPLSITGAVPSPATSPAPAEVPINAAQPLESSGAVPPENKPAKQSAWKFTFALGINASAIAEYNAAGSPDKKTLSGTTSLDMSLNYRKEGGRFEMTNEFHYLFAVQRAGLDDSEHLQKVSDDLNTLHDLSVAMRKGKKWSFNLIAKTSTSVFNIYNGDYFQDVHQMGKTKAFLSPYSVTLSPGIKYTPIEGLRVSLSPFSVSLYGLRDQQIANTGLYTHDSDVNHNYSRFVYKQLGAEINVWYDKRIGRWLEIQYRIGISSDYLNKIGKDGLLDGLFITQFNLFRNISLSHRATLKCDFSKSPFKPYYSQTILLSYTKRLG